jgi:hypothetical protein
MKRHLLLALAVIILGLSSVWLAVGRLAQVNAQERGAPWQTSAEAPAGTPLESFSPADTPAVNNQLEELEGGGLISWRVVGSALKPRDNDVTYTSNSNGSCIYVTAGDANTVWNTPVSLPNGSVVNTLRMYYYDTSASNSTGWFTVYDLYGAIVQEWSVISTGSNGNSFSDSALIDHTIDYASYSYVLNWRPIVTGSTLQLCGFRIFYTPPPFGLEFIPFINHQP